MSGIHPTAVVSPKAKLAASVSIGAYSIIGDHVEIGADTFVGPHVVIEGHTRIGERNKFFQFCSVGSSPQDLKYKGEASELIIGNDNTVREYVTLQPGTEFGGMVTKIGNSNLFMVGSHVGHDAIIGDDNVFANYCSLAGHVIVESRVTVGGLSGIHQFVRIGQLAILGAGAMVAQDIPPFCLAQGDHAKLLGINKVGVSRAGYNSEDIMQLRRAFRKLFWSKKSGAETEDSFKSLSQRIELVESEYSNFEPAKILVEFLKAESKRGLAGVSRKATIE